MMYRTAFILLLSMVLLASCNKEEDAPPAPQEVPPPSLGAIGAYSNLQTGNYWVYQRYQVDSNDVIVQTLAVDSMVVMGDSLVNGALYKVMHRYILGGSGTSVRLWRDSLSYLISSTQGTLFCTDPLDEVIYTLYQGPVGVTLDYTVHSTPVPVSVGAGDFSTYRMRSTITSIGGFPQQPDWKALRSHWAEGVGRVRYYEFYSASLLGYRYDLLRYAVDQ